MSDESDKGKNHLNWNLRPLLEEDKEFLRKLIVRCTPSEKLVSDFHRVFENDWDPEKYQAIYTQEGDVGALSVRENGDHLRIKEIFVDPEFQKRGIATKVIKSVLEKAKSKSLNVRLQVLFENPAIRLYLGLGFIPYRKTETHVLMEFLV